MAGETSKKSATVAKKAAAKRVAAKPTLLAGGNPQIAKADGDAPVQAYIAAIPGWKRDVGRRLDVLIVRAVPGVRKAVKWNSPFYGIEGQGWFLNFHCFTKYIKVAFFRGTSLRPLPPGESKHKEVRYLDIHKDGQLDEARRLGEASQPTARRTNVSGPCEVREWRERTPSRQPASCQMSVPSPCPYRTSAPAARLPRKFGW